MSHQKKFTNSGASLCFLLPSNFHFRTFPPAPPSLEKPPNLQIQSSPICTLFTYFPTQLCTYSKNPRRHAPDNVIGENIKIKKKPSYSIFPYVGNGPLKTYKHAMAPSKNGRFNYFLRPPPRASICLGFSHPFVKPNPPIIKILYCHSSFDSLLPHLLRLRFHFHFDFDFRFRAR